MVNEMTKESRIPPSKQLSDTPGQRGRTGTSITFLRVLSVQIQEEQALGDAKHFSAV